VRIDLILRGGRTFAHFAELVAANARAIAARVTADAVGTEARITFAAARTLRA